LGSLFRCAAACSGVKMSSRTAMGLGGSSPAATRATRFGLAAAPSRFERLARTATEGAAHRRREP